MNGKEINELLNAGLAARNVVWQKTTELEQELKRLKYVRDTIQSFIDKPSWEPDKES